MSWIKNWFSNMLPLDTPIGAINFGVLSPIMMVAPSLPLIPESDTIIWASC